MSQWRFILIAVGRDAQTELSDVDRGSADFETGGEMIKVGRVANKEARQFDVAVRVRAEKRWC